MTATDTTKAASSTPAIIATRGSKLALWQAEFVARKLTEKAGLSSRLEVIRTTGDAVQDRFLHEIGGKGLFVRELEEALAARRADIAVHSLKDMPVNLPSGFALAAVMKRHVAHDVIIFRREIAQALGLGAAPGDGRALDAAGVASLGPLQVASSSLRRSCLIRQAAPKIRMVAVRGNVDTRLRKLAEGRFDAIILAGAALERLGPDIVPDFDQFATRKLDESWFVPCAGQGALAIETRSEVLQSPNTKNAERAQLVHALESLNCANTMRAVTIERNVLRALGGDCTMPFGCHVTQQGQLLSASAVVLDQNGNAARSSWAGPVAGFPGETEVSSQLVRMLRDNGVDTVLDNLGLDGKPRSVTH